MKYRVGNKQSHGVKCYASGGRVSEDISDAGSLPTMSGKSDTSAMSGVDGGKAKSRLDRGGKKGATTVNIVIAGGKPDAGAAPAGGPMPLPPPPMAGPPPAPPMPPGPPMGGPPMMRKNGGRVMTAGAGSGLGRLEKLGKK